MASQQQRGSHDRGRSTHQRSALTLASVASVASVDGSGRAPQGSTPSLTQPIDHPAPQPPRAVSRLLQMKGMTPDEAASLTAFVYGLPISDLHWTLPQLNQLLFLRRLHQIGRFGGQDGDRPLSH